MHQPQMLFTRTFRNIHEQPSSEGHPQARFLRILTPQDTPHDFSHAHQMDFKTHHDRENRLLFYIPTRPRKHADSVGMHFNCRKIAFL